MAPASHNNRILPLLFFILGTLSRLPFLSRYLYSWDSVNFALALNKWDITLHQPHPPGYILYVAFGKLLDIFFHNPNASFLSLSVVASGCAAALFYLMGKELYGKKAGIIATVIFLTSPLFWFYGEVSLTYIVDLVSVLGIALLCLKVINGNERLIIATSFVLGSCGGIREFTVFLLAPLWIFSLWKYNKRKKLLAAGMLLLGIALWFIPLMILSKGPAVYFRYAGLVAQATNEIVTGSYLTNIRENAGIIAYSISMGIGMFLIPLAVGIISANMRVFASRKSLFLLLWFIPAFCFYLIYYLTQPGISIVFLAPLTLSSAITCIRIAHGINEIIVPELRTKPAVRIIPIVLLTVFCSTNISLFLFGKSSLSAFEISSHDVVLADKFSFISETFSPQDTILISSYEWFKDGLRHSMYYLPQYRSVQLAHDPAIDQTGKKYLTAQNNTLVLTDTLGIPREIHNLVLFSGTPDSLSRNSPVINKEDVKKITAFGQLKSVALSSGVRIYYYQR